MHTAANRLFFTLLIITSLLLAARPHIENSLTSALIAHGLYEYTTTTHPDGFLQTSQSPITYSPLFVLALNFFYNFGDYGLVALQGAILSGLAILLIQFSTPHTRLPTRLSSIPILALAIFYIGALWYWQLSPQTTALLFTTISAQFLIKHRKQADWLSFWPLFLIQTIWNYTNEWYWIGLLLVLVFSIEMLLRESLQIGRWSLLTLQNWWPVVFISFLSLLISPPAWGTTFHLFSLLSTGQFLKYPLETISSPWLHNPLFAVCATILIILTFFNTVLHYGQISWTLAIFAFCLGWNTLSSDNYTPLFLLFTLLTLLSSTHLSSRVSGLPSSNTQSPSLVIKLLSAILLAILLHTHFQGRHSHSLTFSWQRYRQQTTATPHQAAQWLAQHASKKKILHPPPLYGCLVLNGVSPSNCALTPITLKYTPETRRKAFLLLTRPYSLPLFINEFQPDFILVDLPRYTWIPILRQLDFQPVFTTHNASVWSRSTDFPTQNLSEPFLYFAHSPTTSTLYERLLRTLTLAASQHLTQAWELFQNLPTSSYSNPLYQKALKIFSFNLVPLDTELFTKVHEWLLTFPHSIHSSWQFQYLLRKTDYSQILTASKKLTPDSLPILAQSYLALNRPHDALQLLQHEFPHSPFKPSLAHLSARAHLALGKNDEAALAYQHALTYAPDDIHLRVEIQDFIKKNNYPSLRALYQHSTRSPLSIPPIQ